MKAVSIKNIKPAKKKHYIHIKVVNEKDNLPDGYWQEEADGFPEPYDPPMAPIEFQILV